MGQPDDSPQPLDAKAQLDPNVPEPASERGAWALALALGLLGAGVLALVLSGVIGSAASRTGVADPPPVLAATPTPVPAVTAPPGALTTADAGSPSPRARST
ncbi:MAG: hypothetical protein WAN93_04940, partial [Solirubrobacteraceae bacterium]